jgi:hypothetical protein
MMASPAICGVEGPETTGLKKRRGEQSAPLSAPETLSVSGEFIAVPPGKTSVKSFRVNAVKRRSGYNPKRNIATQDTMTEEECADLAQRTRYGGNPEHKRNPGDYGLMPPSNPRPGKTLCDASERILKVEAERLLAEGIKKGMVSMQQRNGWPQNVWVVSSTGTVFEAQLEN